MIVITINDAFEAFDRIFKLNEHTRSTGKDLRNMEWLRKETLDLTRTRNNKLIFLGQFIHTQNRDNILKVFVLL